ncbi:hypothetical protein [Flavobacterium daejeonense]|uniref:hypothetical protein n=1 Tax=Flavobacterium daejeonense TaxID=350893 RepID=UPI0012DDCB76|nr:hypothetical protein [Flavobacterium daejeonense]
MKIILKFSDSNSKEKNPAKVLNIDKRSAHNDKPCAKACHPSGLIAPLLSMFNESTAFFFSFFF